MNVRPIGVLKMEDDGGGDEKIIAVPSSRLTQHYQHLQTYTDLPEITWKQIKHFLPALQGSRAGQMVEARRLGPCRRSGPIDRGGSRACRACQICLMED
ncbi:inorganic pyrophosphatase [Bradyrhizobium sp. USDA 3315]